MQGGPGSQIWIIGKGISLLEYKTFPEPNIVINEAIEYVPNATYFIAVDSEQFAKLKPAPETIICVRPEWKDVWKFPHNIILPFDFSGAKYSLWAALKLAKYLKYTRVILRACDSLFGNCKSIGNSNTSKYSAINAGIEAYGLDVWVEKPDGTCNKLLYG